MFHLSATDAIQTWHFTALVNEMLQTAHSIQLLFPHAAIKQKVQPGFVDECLCLMLLMIRERSIHTQFYVCILSFVLDN
jgi:hypothetical protein